MSLLRPNARCADNRVQLVDLLAARDLLRYHNLGNGLSFGIPSHHEGREAARDLCDGVDTLLEPGMVIGMEPMPTLPEGQPGAGA